MFTPNSETRAVAPPESRRVALELTVNNHPGVMSQICGLFARRQYNVEGIVCMPIGRGEHSRIWLLVDKEQRLDQILKQVRKLRDVLDVRSTATDHPVFVQPEDLMESGTVIVQR
jgi:acetolactate synthase I/III small subunit